MATSLGLEHKGKLFMSGDTRQRYIIELWFIAKNHNTIENVDGHVDGRAKIWHAQQTLGCTYDQISTSKCPEVGSKDDLIHFEDPKY
jgi:hypothetical protein